MGVTQIRGKQILDNDITFDDIADGAVRGATGNGGTQRELATGTVSDVDIRNSAVTPLKIDSTQNYTFTSVFVGNGTAGAPTISLTSDNTTGFFRTAVGQIAFSSASTERVKFTASGIDFESNQALNIVVHVLSADPGSPTEGQIWYNNTTHQWKGYNGTSNVLLG